MAVATGILAQWHLKLSQFEVDILRCAGIMHQAADALLRLETKYEDKTHLDDEAADLTIPQENFKCAPET